MLPLSSLKQYVVRHAAMVPAYTCGPPVPTSCSDCSAYASCFCFTFPLWGLLMDRQLRLALSSICIRIEHRIVCQCFTICLWGLLRDRQLRLALSICIRIEHCSVCRCFCWRNGLLVKLHDGAIAGRAAGHSEHGIISIRNCHLHASRTGYALHAEGCAFDCRCCCYSFEVIRQNVVALNCLQLPEQYLLLLQVQTERAHLPNT